MHRNKWLPHMMGLTLILLFLVACVTSPPTTTSTPVPPTATSTPVPPTATPTPVPPTATPTLAAARPQNTEWLVYNTDNSGLPSSLLTPALAFDAQGNLWVGTRNSGLAKFDGETWTVYNTDNSGLPHNEVVALAEDSQENMWIGTNGGGLAKFDGEAWTVYNKDNSGLPYNAVHTLTFDPQGILWIGTGRFYAIGGGGLAKLDGETWVVYDSTNSGLPNNQIINLAFDAQGGLWIGTLLGGLVKFDGEEWAVYNTDNSGLPNNAVISLVFDAQGGLWIGMDPGGLAKLDGEEWTVYNTDNSGLPNNKVHDGLAIDGQGNTWIGTQGGLARFDGEEWTVYDTANSELPDNWIWSIAIDAHGNKWIATRGGGLAAYREGGVTLSNMGAGLQQSIDIPEPPEEQELPDKILFIGNSFTYWNNGFDRHMMQLAGSANPPLVIEAESVTMGGAPLEELWKYTSAREVIGEGAYDVVVLQEDIPETDSWNESTAVDSFHEYARKFDEEIKAAGAETVLFMHWPYEQRGKKPITIEEISQAYRDIAAELGVDVAPVGLAWQRALEERPDLDLYSSDGIHPSMCGTYLAANVVYATVFEESPIGLAYLPSIGRMNVTEDEAAFLQRIAWETVKEYWVQQ